MAYTVRKLLESEQFPKMKLLCGEKGLDLEVKGIRIIEIEDMERYYSVWCADAGSNFRSA